MVKIPPNKPPKSRPQIHPKKLPKAAPKNPSKNPRKKHRKAAENTSKNDTENTIKNDTKNSAKMISKTTSKMLSKSSDFSPVILIIFRLKTRRFLPLKQPSFFVGFLADLPRLFVLLFTVFLLCFTLFLTPQIPLFKLFHLSRLTILVGQGIINILN